MCWGKIEKASGRGLSTYTLAYSFSNTNYFVVKGLACGSTKIYTSDTSGVYSMARKVSVNQIEVYDYATAGLNISGYFAIGY